MDKDNQKPSAPADDEQDPRYEAVLALMRPVVLQVLRESGGGDQSPGASALWQRLARSLSQEAVMRRAIRRAADVTVVEREKSRIIDLADRILESRLIEEAGILNLLVEQGEVYVSAKVAAAIAGCCERSIERAVKAGALALYQVGRDLCVRLGDLREYMARNPQVAPDGAKDERTHDGGSDEEPNGQPESPVKPED